MQGYHLYEELKSVSDYIFQIENGGIVKGGSRDADVVYNDMQTNDLYFTQLYSAKLMLDKANGARYNDLACAFSMRKIKNRR